MPADCSSPCTTMASVSCSVSNTLTSSSAGSGLSAIHPPLLSMLLRVRRENRDRDFAISLYDAATDQSASVGWQPTSRLYRKLGTEPGQFSTAEHFFQ